MTRPTQRALDLALFGLEELSGQLRKDPPAGTSPHDVDRVFARHKTPLLDALAELLDAAIQSASEPTSPSSFKVEVQAGGDRAWSSNAQRFATREQAEAAGEDLFARWVAMRAYRVVPSPDPPNQPLPDVKSQETTGAPDGETYRLVYMSVRQPRPKEEEALVWSGPDLITVNLPHGAVIDLPPGLSPDGVLSRLVAEKYLPRDARFVRVMPGGALGSAAEKRGQKP